MWLPIIRIANLGPIAARTLAHARKGRVVAVFARSAYIDFDGALVCLGAPDIGAGPLNALAGSPAAMQQLRASLYVGDEALREGRSLRAGRVRLDFACAQRWEPVSPALPIDPVRLAQGIAAFRAGAALRQQSEGLACLVTGADAPDALVGPGRDAARALQQWLHAGDDALLAKLGALIGLGPGLTPSGDDFLGGALVALHVYGHVAKAKHLATWLLPRLEGATHPISAAHVRAACEGWGGDALHACLRDIADARDPDTSLARIAAIGHTSGWDALAGAITVAAALVDVAGVPRFGQRARSTRSANSAACAFDGATTTPAASSVRTCRE